MTIHMLVGMAMLSVLVGTAALAAQGAGTGPAPKEPAAAGSQPAAVPLKAVAGKRGILFGAAVVGRLLADPKSPYAQAVARECGIITPENDMKFHPLRPTPDTWEWSNADALVSFAGKHGIKVHGHTLVWHEQLPKWVTEAKRSPQQVRDLMLEHIQSVAGRYRGKIYAWDVVNEAMDKDGGFRSTYWKDALGEEYIDLAFRKAHEVDPKALLVYNDFDIEGPGKKADGVYNLIKGMKQRGVPINAVGFQCHLAVGQIPPIQDFRANIERFRDMGVEVWITELDLRIKIPATPEAVSRQAEEYARLIRMCVETGAVKSIQTWGLDDGHSWVPKFFEGYGDALLLDRNLQPKPAYWAVLKVLDAGSPGSNHP
jgi:endo-1,4-beta-xylanase